ncbi:LOW QUALITY PROTEIN: ras-associating and dilute domain-containing protein-like [Oncorhynchus kisutch]|uniref:LOW QUALITY PROTEIN: ras-associating and dilute domain-containing protein-like n=1 Tax=Oncorhynchus kisutch TaxID=8019 RepID=UPI0012DD9886|nr:LOW QUALITY PROTEIN: ras-associating and dilute domain-containing protein-like [Oncorhynchus kisutch]
MFYGSSSTSGASMSLPSKSRLKRQSRTFTQVLYRTLSYRDRPPADHTSRDRRSVTEPPDDRPRDDPAELSTQSSAPGVLKIFGDEICEGANYKSVLATPRSSAQELVKEALERYSLNKASAHSYVLCDVIGQLEGGGGQEGGEGEGVGQGEGGGWRTECLRAMGDNEKPLLLQELWKPREGHARRFELRRRAEVEELNAKEKDTVTADINAQARKLQRNRTKGTLTLPRPGTTFCRSLSETSLNQLGGADEPKRYYSTLPGPLRARGSQGGATTRRKEGEGGGAGGGGVRHSLYQSPHLLLLQGYNRQDCLVYLLNREQHTVGQETPSARPNICLSSPDILPLHCRLHRVPAPRRHASTPNNNNNPSAAAAAVTGDDRSCVAVEPIPHATVLVNFSRCEQSTQLRHGDLLSFGAHYIFLYKDPTGAKPLPAQTLARLRTLGQLYEAGGGGVETEGGTEGGGTCKTCGSLLKDKGALSSQTGPPARRSFKPHLVKPQGGGAGGTGVVTTILAGQNQKRRLQLDFEQAHEDALVSRIMSLIEPGGDDHKLTPAYLLCLCIQHSASAFPPGCFGKLLLKIVRCIQTVSWEKTKELAQKQAQHQDPASLSLLSISDLIPDLQVVFFWMSNSIEILYFIQQKAPAYTQGIETLDSKGSKESLLSATISANEEAMTILEEVIMYTFQQCVYYITKSLYVVLPGLLDCNPFPVDSSEPCWRGGTGFPEPVRRVLQVFQYSQELLQGYQVHPEVQAQMFSYLFFFSNVSLFNQLMDKGPSRGWFQRSKVLQVQACVRMVLEWTRKVGLSYLADKFFNKFNSAVSILATPPQQLTQMSWKVLCADHPSLKPVQLHGLLTQYQLTAEMGPVPIWQPSSEDEAYIYRTVDLLESFENHPPIVLPSGGFRVDLDSDCLEDSIYRQLLYVRHFLWGLRTHTHTHTHTHPTVNSTHTHTHPTVNNTHTHTHTHPTVNNTHTHTHPAVNNTHTHPAVNNTHTHNPTAVNGTGTSTSTGTSTTPADWQEAQREFPPSHNSPRSGGVEEWVRDRTPGQCHNSVRRNGTAPQLRPTNHDPSCLLTSPNTPRNPEGGGADLDGHAPQVNGCSNSRPSTDRKKSNGLEGSLCEFPFPVPPEALLPDDECCLVFVVELNKGPYGLGMGLIDGLHTPLNAPGIYIRTLIPDGPAESDGRLRIGDRILAVNGTSLIGADYQSAVDLIRLGGGRLRFLVAKSDLEVSEKISASSC